MPLHLFVHLSLSLSLYIHLALSPPSPLCFSSSFLIQCVKIGRGYFTILREENAMKKRQQQLQKLKEEELNKFQPAEKFSDSHYRSTTLLT